MGGNSRERELPNGVHVLSPLGYGMVVSSEGDTFVRVQMDWGVTSVARSEVTQSIPLRLRRFATDEKQNVDLGICPINMTIGDVKHAAAERFGIQCAQIRLAHRGHELDQDTATLAEARIQAPFEILCVTSTSARTEATILIKRLIGNIKASSFSAAWNQERSQVYANLTDMSQLHDVVTASVVLLGCINDSVYTRDWSKHRFGLQRALCAAPTVAAVLLWLSVWVSFLPKRAWKSRFIELGFEKWLQHAQQLTFDDPRSMFVGLQAALLRFEASIQMRDKTKTWKLVGPEWYQDVYGTMCFDFESMAYLFTSFASQMQPRSIHGTGRYDGMDPRDILNSWEVSVHAIDTSTIDAVAAFATALLHFEQCIDATSLRSSWAFHPLGLFTFLRQYQEAEVHQSSPEVASNSASSMGQSFNAIYGNIGEVNPFVSSLQLLVDPPILQRN